MLTDQQAPVRLVMSETTRPGNGIHSPLPFVTIWAYGPTCPPGFYAPGGGKPGRWLLRRPYDELLPILRTLANAEERYQVFPGQTLMIGRDLLDSPIRTNIIVLRVLGIPIDAPDHDARLRQIDANRALMRAFLAGFSRDLNAILSEEANRVAAQERLAEWLRREGEA